MVRHAPGEPLYNVEKAWIPEGKIAGYALNPNNDKGKYKALLFEKLLDITAKDADLLRRQIMDQARALVATPKKNGVDIHGERFNVLIPVTGNNGKTLEVVTAWIYDRSTGSLSTVPRLTTVYIDRKKNNAV